MSKRKKKGRDRISPEPAPPPATSSSPLILSRRCCLACGEELGDDSCPSCGAEIVTLPGAGGPELLAKLCGRLRAVVEPESALPSQGWQHRFDLLLANGMVFKVMMSVGSVVLRGLIGGTSFDLEAPMTVLGAPRIHFTEASVGLRQPPLAQHLLSARVVAVGVGSQALMDRAVAELRAAKSLDRIEPFLPMSPPSFVSVEITEPRRGVKMLRISIGEELDWREFIRHDLVPVFPILVLSCIGPILGLLTSELYWLALIIFPLLASIIIAIMIKVQLLDKGLTAITVDEDLLAGMMPQVPHFLRWSCPSAEVSGFRRREHRIRWLEHEPKLDLFVTLRDGREKRMLRNTQREIVAFVEQTLTTSLVMTVGVGEKSKRPRP